MKAMMKLPNIGEPTWDGAAKRKSASDVAIRALMPVHAEAYRQLMLRALQDFPASFGVSHEEVQAQALGDVADRLRGLDQCGEIVLGAFDGGGELLGVVGLRRMSLVKMRHKAVVGRMYVVRASQRMGLGKRLLEAVVKAARDVPGIEQLSLVVHEDNVGARVLYTSLGFTPFGVEPRELKIDGRYHNSVHMWLALD